MLSGEDDDLEHRTPRASSAHNISFSELDQQQVFTWKTLCRKPNKPNTKQEATKAVGHILGSLVVGLTIFILSVLMYWGTSWLSNTGSMEVVIIQSDPGFNNFSIGQLVVNTLRSYRDSNGFPAGQFKVVQSPGVEQVPRIRRSVRDEHAWFGLQIPANLTFNYLLAIRGLTVNRSYPQVLQAFANFGRSSSVTRQSTVLSGIITALSQQLALQVASGQALGPINLNAAAPQALVKPLNLQLTGLFIPRVGVLQMMAVVIVLSWGALVSSISAIRTTSHQLYFHLSPWMVAVFRFCALAVWDVLLGLAWASLFAAFGVEFASNFGAVWWFAVFVCWSFTSFIYFLVATFGPLAPVLLVPIMVLQLNMSGAYVAPETCYSHFYSWGNAWPWYHAYRGLRGLIVGTPDTTAIGIDLGVLAIWGGVFFILDWVFWLIRVPAAFSRVASPDTPLGAIFSPFSLSQASATATGLGSG